MTRFAYPNVNASDQFAGCGRYLAASPNDARLHNGYALAVPNVGNLSTITTTASLFAKESFESGKHVYEYRDTAAAYFGDSLGLAYLLALIHRSRPTIWDEANFENPEEVENLHDIWCTGTITLSGGIPMLGNVYRNLFDAKIHAFLIDDTDALFILSIANIEPRHQQLFKQHDVRLISLDQFSEHAAQELLARKTILQLHANELELLVRNLFVSPVDDGAALANPYRGLFAFQEQNKQFFFGRKMYTIQLFEMVQMQPFVVIVGASGSGKTSLVYAGLFSQLRRRGDWIMVSFRPGNDPFHALAQALVPFLYEDELIQLAKIQELTEQFNQGTISLQDTIDLILQKQPEAKNFLLFIDQFEELYTLCRDETLCHRFLDEFLKSWEHGEFFSRLVITIRTDFLDQAFSYRLFADAFQYAPLILGPMTREELKAAIEQPASTLNVHIEPGLTERILKDVIDSPGSLPLLEFTLTELWKRREHNTMTEASYHEIGGVGNALASYAEHIYCSLEPEEQQHTHRIFSQLVLPGAGRKDNRRIATRAEIGDAHWHLVIKLADARLVVTNSTPFLRGTPQELDQGEHAHEETVEIVHETLITEWQRLKYWIDTDREFRIWQERLRALIPQPSAPHDLKHSLLRGTLLTYAEEWFKKRPYDLSSSERRFIETSLRERSKQQRWQQIKSGVVMAAMLMAATVFALLWNQAEIQRRIILEQKRFADEQRRIVEKKSIEALGVSAKALFLSYDDLGALLAIVKAGKMLRSADVPAELRVLIMANFVEIIKNIHEKNRLEQHAAPVVTAAFSPDGKMLVSGGNDGTITTWELDKNCCHIKTFQGHEGATLSVDVRSDNTMMASAGFDGLIKLWEPVEGREVGSLQGHSGVLHRVVFSPDGALLASSGADGSIRLWNVADGDPISILQNQGAAVACLNFSPDGTRLVSGSDEGRVTLWNVADGREIARYPEPFGIVYSVHFSPDGKIVASGHENGDIILRKVDDGLKIATLQGHSGFVAGLHFSPDGLLLASGGSDRIVIVWSVENLVKLNTFQGHFDTVYHVEFSPDGTLLASASWDATIKLWGLEKNVPDTESISHLLIHGCNWLQDYLRTNPNINQADRTLCDNVLKGL